MWITTDCKSEFGLVKQDVMVNASTMEMRRITYHEYTRRQSLRHRYIWKDDFFNPGDEEWLRLFREYGLPALIRHRCRQDPAVENVVENIVKKLHRVPDVKRVDQILVSERHYEILFGGNVPGHKFRGISVGIREDNPDDEVYLVIS